MAANSVTPEGARFLPRTAIASTSGLRSIISCQSYSKLRIPAARALFETGCRTGVQARARLAAMTKLHGLSPGNQEEIRPHEITQGFPQGVLLS